MAFWRAQNLGRQLPVRHGGGAWEPEPPGWPTHLRVALIMVFLVAGLMLAALAA